MNDATTITPTPETAKRTIEVTKKRTITYRLDPPITLTEAEIKEAVLAWVRSNTKGLKDFALDCAFLDHENDEGDTEVYATITGTSSTEGAAS